MTGKAKGSMAKRKTRGKRRQLDILVMLLLAVMAGRGDLAATEQKVGGAEFVTYFGYSDCIKLANKNARVVLCPHGGRVLEYSWRGENSLYLDPTQEGWTYVPGERPVDPCGGRFDIGPEMIVPRHPNLWLGKWEGKIVGPRAARLTSIPDEATGTQLIREFTLSESSSKLLCKQIINNVSSDIRFPVVPTAVGAVVVTRRILGFQSLTQPVEVSLPRLRVMFWASAVMALPYIASRTSGADSFAAAFVSFPKILSSEMLNPAAMNARCTRFTPLP